ncbi:MAG: DHHA1 domain-containing protein [bacterium]
MKAAAAVVGGSGGGKAEMAQAGGKDSARLPDALARAREFLTGALSTG